jgi:calcineurin-like phosphoesterase family protein
MVMPFVVSATMKNGYPEFNLKLIQLWNEMNATPIDTAKRALKCLTDSKYVHGDVKWSHIALLRTFDVSKNHYGLKPIVLDLVQVEIVESVELAMSEMHAQGSIGFETEWT